MLIENQLNRIEIENQNNSRCFKLYGGKRVNLNILSLTKNFTFMLMEFKVKSKLKLKKIIEINK